MFEVLSKLHITFLVVRLSLHSADLLRTILCNRLMEKQVGELSDIEGSPFPGSRVVQPSVQEIRQKQEEVCMVKQRNSG